MSSRTPRSQIPNKLADLTNRVKKLEDEVVKGDPLGFGERLKELADELAALQENSSNRIDRLDQRIDQFIRVVAELPKSAIKKRDRPRSQAV